VWTAERKVVVTVGSWVDWTAVWKVGKKAVVTAALLVAHWAESMVCS
jgi:hypothetical protein